MSQPADLESLWRYFDATRDSHVASAPSQAGPKFSDAAAVFLTYEDTNLYNDMV